MSDDLVDDLTYVHLPDWCTVKFAFSETQSAVMFCYVDGNGETLFHVAAPLGELNAQSIPLMVNNLGGAIFELEYPWQLFGLLMERARCASEGRELSDETKSKLSRMEELSFGA